MREQFQFSEVDESVADEVMQLATDKRLRLLACCVVHQQNAGFKDRIDLRQVSCPECGEPGFNTGWGSWRFVCGAEILPDGEITEPCGPVAVAPPPAGGVE